MKVPKFIKLERGQKKLPKDMIKPKAKEEEEPKAKGKKRGKWEVVSEDETAMGLDALGQALKDTGWHPTDNDISAYS